MHLQGIARKDVVSLAVREFGFLYHIEEDLFDGFVTGEVADVISRTGHFPSVDGYFCGEPGDKTARCIDAATFRNALIEHFQVLLPVIVEGGAAPVTLGAGWFFFHGENKAIVIHFCHTTLMEALFI